MCLAVYIASDAPLRTLPFDTTRPGFHVKDVPVDYEAVKQHFTKPFVCYAGADEGCGCGFYVVQYYSDQELDPDEVARANACRADLEAFLRQALHDQPTVELYACWFGDEAIPPESRRTLPEPSFPTGFTEREFLVIGKPILSPRDMLRPHV